MRSSPTLNPFSHEPTRSAGPITSLFATLWRNGVRVRKGSEKGKDKEGTHISPREAAETRRTWGDCPLDLSIGKTLGCFLRVSAWSYSRSIVRCASRCHALLLSHFPVSPFPLLYHSLHFASLFLGRAFFANNSSIFQVSCGPGDCCGKMWKLRMVRPWPRIPLGPLHGRSPKPSKRRRGQAL